MTVPEKEIAFDPAEVILNPYVDIIFCEVKEWG
jgi:hypothetical protein